MLCNFDEFRIYDFDTDLDEPKDTIALKDLPERREPHEFLALDNSKPNFENERESAAGFSKYAEVLNSCERCDRMAA